MDRPNIIAFSRGFHRRNVNGKNVLNKDYDLKINPNNQNKVILETRENDKNYKKKYDSPNSFIKTFIEKQSLFDMIRHDDNLVKPKKKTKRNNKKARKKGTKGKKDLHVQARKSGRARKIRQARKSGQVRKSGQARKS